MPNSFYINPRTNQPATAEEMRKLGYPVSPEDLQQPIQEQQPIDPLTKAINASATPNAIEREYSTYNNPFSYISNLFNKTKETASDIGTGIGRGIDYAGEEISNTLSDVGDWASKNKIALGGLGTAIGAGFARRDPSEALARYNQSIIANKQQEAREEELRMLKDSTHPYNQQFRNLFKQLIPDVAAKLGDNFEKMTVQNFKDAGLTDLLDVTQKRITIDMSDPTSQVSQRARNMAQSQYGINIPDNISANEVKNYIDAINKQKEQSFKEREVSTKEQKLLDEKTYKNILAQEKIKEGERGLEKLDLEKEEAKRKAELHQPELDKLKKQNLETQLKIDKDDPNSEASKMAYKSLVQSTKEMFKGKILGKSFSPESIPKNLSANEYSKLTDDIIRHRQSLLQMSNTKDIADANRNMQREMRKYAESQANYRASIQNKLGYSRLGEQQRHNKEMEEYYKNKEANKYGDVFINEGDLKSRGLTPTTINKKIESAAGAMNLIEKSKQIITSLDKVGYKDIAGLTELSGVLKTLSTQIDLDEKQRSALGAYDKGVQELMDKMKSDPTGIKTLYARNRVKAQYQTMINEIIKGYKNQSRISGYDPRFGSPTQFTLELEDAIQNQNPESIQRFKDMGYDSDDMLEAYGKKFTVKKRGQ